MTNSITDIPGILVGHADNRAAGTGCTVVLCESGAVAGVDARGGAPGTRETDCLAPVNVVPLVHAVYLGGGSAFGLEGATGVMRFLESKGIGFDAGVGKVPIVPGAVLFDLAVGDPGGRPDASMGELACKNAGISVLQGNVGAGTGAAVGRAAGLSFMMKG
ncbi:MAG TPA: P1 family peptidase, partial [Spirochaetia bacterium]|nr:P1 family peptidase [Spirochaetia bacterium]